MISHGECDTRLSTSSRQKTHVQRKKRTCGGQEKYAQQNDSLSSGLVCESNIEILKCLATYECRTKNETRIAFTARRCGARPDSARLSQTQIEITTILFRW